MLLGSGRLLLNGLCVLAEREPGANIVWLETQAESEKDRKKANSLRAKAKTMRKNPDAWVERSKIKSEALPLITAWQARSDDIKRRLASGIFK